MASPFYTPINVNQSDFSPITRGAESYGRSVGAGLASIGEAVGKVASSYFEEKGFEEQASEFMLTPEGQEYLKRQNLSVEDKPKALKLITGAIKSQGGFKAFKQSLMDEQEFQTQQKISRQQIDINADLLEKNELALEELKKTQFESTEKQNLFSQAFKRGDDGQFSFDIGNIKTTDENAYLLPQVYKQAKDMNLLGNFNYSKWKSDLTSKGLWDASNRQGMTMFLDQSMGAFGDVSGQDGKRYRENLKNETYEVGKISEEARNWWNSNPNAKSWVEAEETASKINTSLNTAIGTKADGSKYVRNASSAGMVIRSFARLANGVGVMTDKDVSSVSGASDAWSVWDRLSNKFFGETRVATQEDVDSGLANQVGEEINYRYGATASLQDLQDIQKATKALEEVNVSRLQEHGRGLQNYLKESFIGVPEDRLLKLSPFSHYWHKDHNFTINKTDLPSANRMLMTQGVDAFVSNLKENNPNMTDVHIAKIVNQVRGYESPQQNSGQVATNESVDPRSEIDESSRTKVGENMDLDQTTYSLTKAGGSGYVGSKVVGKWMTNNYNRANMLESIGEPFSRYKEGMKAFDKAPIKEVKEYGKQMGVDRKDFKTEKAFRSELKKRFKNEIKGEVAKYLTKQKLPKKIVTKLIGGTITGGVGLAFAGASILYDLYDLSTSGRELSEQQLLKMKEKHPKGSEGAKVIDQMIRELSPRYRLSQGNDSYLQQEEIGGYGFPLSP